MTRISRQHLARQRGRAYRQTARFAVFVAAVAAAAMTTGCHTAQPPPQPLENPNVLLITIDTLRSDHVGAYGHDRDTTPNLDRLATEGVRFANASSVSSWTLPGHASLLTGLYPAEHGVVSDHNALPPSAVTLAEIFQERGYETYAAVSHVYLTSRWGFAQGFDALDDRVAEGSPHRPVASRIVDSALGWLSARNDTERPFFAWLHIFDPHWDYSPPSPWDTRFDGEYTGSMTGDYSSMRPYIKALATREKPPELSGRDVEHLLALYDGEIAYADHHVGRLLDRLGATGELDDTLIVFTSDHGEEFMEHGSLEGHQWTLYDEVVQVPFMMRFPDGRHAGAVVDRPVSTVTAAGTILDALGIAHELPTSMALLEPRLASREAEDDVVLDLTVRRHQRTVGIRTEDFKLLRGPDNRVELYEKPDFGNEQYNVARKRSKVVAQLSTRLTAKLDTMKRLADAGVTREPLDHTTVDRLRTLGYAD